MVTANMRRSWLARIAVVEEHYQTQEQLLHLPKTQNNLTSGHGIQQNDWRTVDSISTTWTAKAFLGTNRYDNKMTNR